MTSLSAPKKRTLMRVTGFIFSLLLFSLTLPAEVNNQSAEKGESTPPPTNIIPLPPSKSLSAAQLAGKKLFVKECSICHLPRGDSMSTNGPLLDGKLVALLGESTVREQIMRGTARMPGWQYTLEPEEIDKIIGYLKTLDFSKK
jgi:mono/diheme cytochrome c family protein